MYVHIFNAYFQSVFKLEKISHIEENPLKVERENEKWEKQRLMTMKRR